MFQLFAPEPRSLFGEILDWMLAPLLFLWPISMIVTHNVADDLANQPYDRALADSVRTLARLVTTDEGGRIAVHFPAPPRAMFRADEDDAVYYQVSDVRGSMLTGDAEIPPAEVPPNLFAEEVLFRDEMIHG